MLWNNTHPLDPILLLQKTPGATLHTCSVRQTDSTPEVAAATRGCVPNLVKAVAEGSYVLWPFQEFMRAY